MGLRKEGARKARVYEPLAVVGTGGAKDNQPGQLTARPSDPISLGPSMKDNAYYLGVAAYRVLGNPPVPGRTRKQDSASLSRGLDTQPSDAGDMCFGESSSK